MTLFRILVVEDNPVIRDLFRLGIDKLQNEMGGGSCRYEVEQAGDGGSAWKYLQENPVDLLVVDLYLPVLNGLDIIRKIRETPNLRAMKVLAISASIHDARDRSLAAGADMFQQKPLRLFDLLGAIRTLLRAT